MAVEYKVLGQSAPSAATNTNVYTVPSLTSAIISTITIANRGATDGSYRIAVRPAGATLENKHYISYDIDLPSYTSDNVTIGITLATTDIITVYASTSDFSFNLFGSELT